MSDGQPNPLPDRLSADPGITAYLEPERVRSLLKAEDYVGDAPQRARHMAERLRTA